MDAHSPCRTPDAPAIARATHGHAPSRTDHLATLAFFAIAVLDTLYARTFVTGNAWLVLVLVWLLPWPNHSVAATRPLRLDRELLFALATLAVFVWLYVRTWTVLSDVLFDWRPIDSESPWRRFNFPLQTTLMAFAIAALLARPLHRTFATHASAVALLLATPLIALTCLESLADLTGWQEHTTANAIQSFEAIFPALLLMQACALLERRRRRAGAPPTAPDRTLLSRLGSLFDRCPRWFARSAVAPLLLLTLAAAIFRVWVDVEAELGPALSAAASLALPACTLLLTAAVIHRLRQRRAAALAGTGWARLRIALRTTLGVLLLAPLWLWTLAIDAPLAGFHAQIAATTLRGSAWELTYDPSARTLRLSGGYEYGIADNFLATLQALPDVTRVELEGPGGLTGEGFAIASAIEARGLSTHVTGECASACTIAFIAGRERTVGPDATLGFHSSWSPALLYDDDDADYNAYLERRGVTAAFIHRADDIPSRDMWYPTHEELLSAGVVTALEAPPTP